MTLLTDTYAYLMDDPRISVDGEGIYTVGLSVNQPSRERWEWLAHWDNQLGYRSSN